MRLCLVAAALLVASPALAQGIAVHSAIYGANCGSPSNVSGHVAQQCEGRSICRYRIDHHVIGDPAVGCGKDFRVRWSCGGAPYRTGAGPEASGKMVFLHCP
jgi:hypothetical protein